MISYYYDNLLSNPFKIDKILELIVKEYYWLIFYCNIKDYIKICNIYLILKIAKHKLYSKLNLLPIPTYWLKYLFINFDIKLPVSTNWKNKTYNLVLVIAKWLIKIVHYNLIKIIIDILGLVKIITNILIRY